MKVGMDKVGMVKRLLVGQAEVNKADWSKSTLPSISSDHRREGLMLTEHPLCHRHGGQHISACQVHQGQHEVHQAAAEATWGEAAQCWGGSGHSLPAKAAGGWVQQPAGPAGHGGEDVEEGAGQALHH